MEDYKQKLGGLASKLKTSPPSTPIQEVHPVKTVAAEKDIEVQFNNWIPKSLLKQIKALAVEKDLSLKDCNIEALKLYIKTNGKH